VLVLGDQEVPCGDLAIERLGQFRLLQGFDDE
jgi:hypothetical protein